MPLWMLSRTLYDVTTIGIKPKFPKGFTDGL
nr:MAG TPA: hypothetical protein [Caudoviricetes sp.]